MLAVSIHSEMHCLPCCHCCKSSAVSRCLLLTSTALYSAAIKLCYLCSPSLCGACASRLCTAHQGCCLNAARTACSCNSTRGLEPSPAAGGFCKWALRLMSWRLGLPANKVVALPFWLAGPRAAAPPYVSTPVCPPQGLSVFPGSSGSNPLGTALVYQRRVTCQGNGFLRLPPAASDAMLGESCAEGRGALLFNVTLPQRGSRGSCWLVTMKPTDGSKYNATFQFY
jgi:hypothetical protein